MHLNHFYDYLVEIYINYIQIMHSVIIFKDTIKDYYSNTEFVRLSFHDLNFQYWKNWN